MMGSAEAVLGIRWALTISAARKSPAIRATSTEEWIGRLGNTLMTASYEGSLPNVTVFSTCPLQLLVRA